MGGGRERTRMMRMRMMIDRLIGLEKVRWSCYFHCVRACVHGSGCVSSFSFDAF